MSDNELLKSIETLLDKKLEPIHAKLDKHDLRFEKIDQRFEKIDQRFEKIDQRFEKIDQRFEKIDQRFEKIESEIGTLHTEIGTVQYDIKKQGILFEDHESRHRDLAPILTDIQSNVKIISENMERLQTQVNLHEIAIKRLSR